MWHMGIPDVYPLMASGPDNARRLYLFARLIELYKGPPNKCLQVGVAHWLGQKYGPSFIALDLYDKRDCIDVRENIEHTSFDDNTFDLIVCNAVLEHVRDPFQAVKEMSRICKPNRFIWAEVPFVQPYHPTKKKYDPSDGLLIDEYNQDGPDDFNHGGDYWRFTPQGVCQLMKPFAPIEVLLGDDGGIAFYGENKK